MALGVWQAANFSTGYVDAIVGGVSEDVLTGDPLTVVDQILADWFQAHAVPLVTQFMVVVSNLHGVVAISTYAVLFALYLLWKRDWVWLVCLATTVPGGMLLNVLMKHAFQRARPSVVDPLLALSTYSYPSGHVAGTALFYGVLGTKVDLHLERLWSHNVTITTGLVDTFSVPMLLKTLQSERLNAKQLITHHFKFDQILDAYETFAKAADTKALKVIIEA